MKQLHAPWRNAYAQNQGFKKRECTPQTECAFCVQFADPNDEKHFILRHFNHNVVILNRFPYNAGHLLIMPVKHIPQLHDMSPEARIELIELATHSSKIVQDILQAHGVNVGINLGKAAGAGIPSHLHLHVLPRWLGDTNFLPVLGETKQISFDLTDIYKQLKPAFDALTIELR
ncbi:MAG: HIT domain-containing protein [bacterium]|nr:HIT domain-containing protein [bacterium]